MQLQIRTTNDDPDNENWSDWSDFVIGDYTARGMQFRLLMAIDDPEILIDISQLSVTVDMPDRVEGRTDVTSLIGVTDITYNQAFWTRPALAVDAQGMQEGDVRTITNQSKSGFSIP